MTRILLVEDEIALSDPLSFLLEREGYEVEVAADGPSAITAFDQRGAAGRATRVATADRGEPR